VDDPGHLLRRHKPFLKYDSHECYFADSAAEWTDNPGNRLEGPGGKVIAGAAGAGGAADLSLAFLGPARYGSGEPVHPTDLISDDGGDYARQANLLHRDRRYRNRIYGHAATDSEGKLWLQYWFFYFYNDFNLIGDIFGAGRHEGDWEMIQLRVGEDGAPDRAAFAQHKHAEVRRWDQVDLLPETQQPIVYVARGSHASYFEPGRHSTGAWPEWADGKRRSPRLTLEIVDDARPEYRWLLWPGHWGDTKPGVLPFDADSPVGPGAHEQWRDPLALVPELRSTVPSAAGEAKAVPPSLASATAAHTPDGGLAVRYEASPAGAERLRGLVITVNSPDEASPPATYTVEVTDPAGTVEPAIPLDPAKRYDVYTSAVFADHVATGSVRSDLEPRAR
jgi:VPS62-like protein